MANYTDKKETRTNTVAAIPPPALQYRRYTDHGTEPIYFYYYTISFTGSHCTLF